MTSSISAKIQDGGRNLEKSKFFRGARGVALFTLGIRNLPKISLSLTVFEINDVFHFHINSDGGQNSKKSKHFRGPSEVVLSTLGSQKFARNLSISYIFQYHWRFPFVPKFKMAAEFQRSLNF